MAMLANLKREERIGLGIAAGLHAALVLAFLVQPDKREAIEPVERMTVNLAGEVGLEAEAPEPVPESRAAMAPTLADEPAPVPVPEAVPEPAEALPAQQAPPPPAVRRPLPAKTSAPPVTREPRRSEPARTTRQQKPAAKTGGAQREFDKAFSGAGESTTTAETRVPANRIGAAEKASLVQAIGREIKPHWQPPSGPDVDRIVTVLRFRLNPDGSLNGRPVVLRQTGINDTNRAQADRHGEQAIRAVQLAAPFDLPERYYDAWKLVSPFAFDWKLAQ